MIYFLKLDGIPGESLDDKHRDEIDVLSMGWAVSQTGTASTGDGGGAGKAIFQDLHVFMRVNRASPLLMLACAQGTHIKEAILTARRSGNQTPDFFTIKLTDLIVSSVEETGEGELEQRVAFDYAKIEYSYQRQRADGSLENPVTAGWDLKANTKV